MHKPHQKLYIREITSKETNLLALGLKGTTSGATVFTGCVQPSTETVYEALAELWIFLSSTTALEGLWTDAMELHSVSSPLQTLVDITWKSKPWIDFQ